MPPRRPQQQGKRKPASKPSPPTSTPVAEDDALAADRFKVELQWCVQQLEAAMKKASLKEREDMAKSHRTLTSSKAQLIKKRQVMSAMFGDYRSKMAQEETKMKTEMPKMKKSAVPPGGSVFIRKSAVHSSSTVNRPPASSEESVMGSLEPGVAVTETPGNQSTSVGFLEEAASGDEAVNVAGNTVRNSSEKDLGVPEPEATPFKFTSSGNTFKFDFTVS